MKRRSVLITCLSLAVAHPASAAIIHVPADEPTIQAGIDAALSGDTVQVASGTYTGPGNRDISFDGKGLLVKSKAGADSTIIDCQGSEIELHRGFYFHSGEDSTAMLTGFTIRNGHAPGDFGRELAVGGGILCEASSPCLLNCILEDNYATNAGGGMACLNGASPRIAGCRFEGNSAGDEPVYWTIAWGGALRCVSSSPTIHFCTFADNRATYGGAISCYSADVTISLCEFTGNLAYRPCAGECAGPGTGGALHLSGSSPHVAFSTFSSNTAEWGPPCCGGADLAGRGGAMRIVGYSNPTITNCTFYANSAQSISGHPGEGGVFSVEGSSSPTMQRCILAGSLDGEALRCYDWDSLSHPLLLCCDLFANAGGDWTGCIADQAGTAGNFSADPLFCDAASADFTLQESSPCGPQVTGCGLVGAGPVACGGFVQDTLWVAGEQSDHVVIQWPLLSWSQSQVSPQSEYEIQVGSDPDWATAEMWQPGVAAVGATDVFYAGEPLLDGVTYWARVRAGDGSIWSSWLETSFRMNSAPVPPILISPLDTVEVATDRPILTAVLSPEAELDPQRVEFSVWRVEGSWPREVSPFIADSGSFQGDTLAWQINVLLQENYLYGWLARATDGYATSLSSPEQYFWVNAVAEAPGTPILYQPAANAMIYAAHPSLVWSFATDPDPNATVWYELVVAGDSTFLAVVEADSLTDTSHTLTAALETGRQFWWKVICQSSDGQSAASQKRPFGMYLPGDVNGTWTVTSADIIALVGYVFRGALLTVPECAGRTNGDGVITSADIIWLVNAVFKSGPIPIAGCE